MLLGARLGMSGVGGSPLPYDAEVEYLQGDGSAYIDNVIDFGGETVTSIGIDFDISVSVDNGTTGYPFAFCPRTSVGSGSIRTRALLSSGIERLYLHSAANTGAGVLNLGSADGYDRVKMLYSKSNGGSASFSFDGLLSSSNTPTGTYQTPSGFALSLFCAKYINSSGATTYSDYFNGKIYCAKIKNINTNQDVDLIPVRVGQVGYMYDRVSGELFGNAGSGAFILGPDK